jgi:type I restriction enzyme S subunit
MEQQVVRDASAVYLVEADNATVEDVPPGYKRTEVGIIPSEWDIAPILNLVQLPNGQVDPKVEPYRSMTLVAPDHIAEKTGALLARVSAAAQGAISGKFVFEPGDVIYSKIRPYLQKAFSASFKGLCSADMYPLRPRPGVSSGFILNTLLSDNFTEFAISVSARSGIPKINRQELAQYKVATPPPGEQRAIATALSDADVLIESLDRLIAKKRAIKQATMQQLLTGQTRLPGFTGEWETKCLGDHVSFLKTGTNSRAELTSNGRVAYLHYGDIHVRASVTLNPNSVTMPHIAASKVRRLDKLAPGDLVFVDASEDLEGVGKSVEIIDVPNEGIVSGLHTIAARFDKAVLADGFKAYLQFCPQFIGTLRRLAAGTKVLATNRQHVASVKMELPCVAEQQAIATVLADMDTDIEALEHRRDKARQIKQGMMQQLLTGRVRLVAPHTTEPAAC